MMGRQNARRMRALRLFGAALLGMIFLAAFLAGCSRREEEREPLARGQYYIYYLNSSMTRLVSRVYEAQETEGGALVEELMGQFLTVPEDLDCQPALSERVTYQGSRRRIRCCICTLILIIPVCRRPRRCCAGRPLRA